MGVLRRFLPPLAAAATFVACLAVGMGADRMVRWLEPMAGHQPLTVAVRSGQSAMRIANLTDATWNGCVVTVEGGWQSRPFAIEPRKVERVPYQAFLAGALPQGDRPEFAQAFHRASVRCRDAAGNWQNASVR